MSVKKASPGGAVKGQFDELLKAAFGEPGEWFSSPLGETSPQSAGQNISRAIARQVAEVTIRGDEVFVRVLP